MTRLLYALVVVLLAGAAGLVALGARGGATPAPVPAASLPPTVVISPAARDFGDQQRSAVPTATFTLRNTHAVSVECGPVTKGCSCASAEVESKTIPPGGEATLAVVWKLASKRGPSVEAVSVPYTGEGGVRGAVYARVAAKVRTAIEPSVEVLELSRDKPAGEVTFTSPSGKPFRVTGAGANHPCLTATVDAAANVGRVRFDPAVSGWESGRLAVTVTTDEPEDREVVMSVRVTNQL